MSWGVEQTQCGECTLCEKTRDAETVRGTWETTEGMVPQVGSPVEFRQQSV